MGRILPLKIALVAGFVVVALRLIQVQVVQASAFKEIAKKQYEQKIPVPASRGSILDRNGRVLVSNITTISFGADPQVLGSQAPRAAERFASVFGKPRSFYLSKLADRERRFVWMERRTTEELAARIHVKDFPGIIQINEPQRLYHFDHLAGQMIGFTDIDNNGLSGVELQFDQFLRGVDGYVIMERDAIGRKRPSLDYPVVEPVHGKNIVLTIDEQYQEIAEEELRKGVERNKAESGLVVMMDPSTGEILAMANYPSFNPNHPSQADQSVTKNRAITDMFEPGSMFKIVTVAAALEFDVVKPKQKFYGEGGQYVVSLPGGKKRLITDTHPLKLVSFQEAVAYSSNIVMAKVSNIIGAERMFTMARNFGFGTLTGLDLPGESGGELKKPAQWSSTTLNSLAYGYEIGATPLQIAAAYSAVANHGVLHRPYVIQRIFDEKSGVITESHPQRIRNVIDGETARRVTEMLVGAVERGTGVSAKVKGIPVAGKTGTAWKVMNGRYQKGMYTASFAGYFPADDPAIVCVVMLDNPTAGGYTGGLTSAPIFGEIAARVSARASLFLHTAQHLPDTKGHITVPDLRALTRESAASLLASLDLEVATKGKGKLVIRQNPRAGSRVRAGQEVSIETEPSDPVKDGIVPLPDVVGLSMRRAINRLTIQGLDYSVEGSGVVTLQTPRAGERVKPRTRVLLHCESPRVAFAEQAR